MREQTIYNYQLLYRFRWGLLGYLFQVVCLGGLLYVATLLFPVQIKELLLSLSILAVVPVMQIFLFRLYAYSVSTKPKLSPDMLFSPWWGAGTAYPSSQGFYRAAESTVCIGSLFIPAALFNWLPLSFGIDFVIGGIICLLPRLVGLVHSLRHPKHCRVKYESRSVSFLLT